MVTVGDGRKLNVPLIDVGNDGCRYPVRSFGRKHVFCNVQTEEYNVYCYKHRRIAFRAFMNESKSEKKKSE